MGGPSSFMHTQEPEEMTGGFYVAFEGADGVGKTTVMNAVADKLEEEFSLPEIIRTRHPGSTPLGAHLRKLVKTPQLIDPKIEMNPMCRQALYMVDSIDFIQSILIPSLRDGKIVLADRCTHISSVVYGIADDIGLAELDRMYSVIQPPKLGRLYVLNCPTDVASDRLGHASEDHYDNQSLKFKHKLHQTYDELITGDAERAAYISRLVSLHDIMVVDAALPISTVTSIITVDILSMLKVKGVFKPPQ